MKFDFIIGNPPYQEPAPGTSTSDKPIYNFFMDAAYNISDKVELITPGRFLFEAGATPSTWNKKMLSDPHFKVLHYEIDSNKIFPNTAIVGGIAITFRDLNQNFGAICTFTAFSELNSILYKVRPDILASNSLDSIIYTQSKFNLTVLNEALPELGRTDKRLESNIFKLKVFHDSPESDNDIKILGLSDNKRTYKYIDRKFLDFESGSNINKYKVILSKSNGASGILCNEPARMITVPVIGEPFLGYTRTFIGIGSFDSEFEANAALKYVKGKFCRVMLGILKVTQDNNPEKWKYVPLQDFTSSSDIDWSKSISEIDQQLYEKYDLNEDEIAFIESHVKEME